MYRAENRPPQVTEAIRTAFGSGALVAAICAAVDVIEEAGILSGLRSTHSTDEDCVRDKNVVTARANAYVGFGIGAAKYPGLFTDEADLAETVDFWKYFKGQNKPSPPMGRRPVIIMKEPPMANFLTGLRIVCGLMLLPFAAFSRWYYALYLLGGLTDAVDGTVARKTGSASEAGARFDTVADTVFVLAVLVKTLPVVSLPGWVVWWTCGIALIKVFSAALGLVGFRRFPAVHSVLNKLTGAALFTLPFLFGLRVPTGVRTAVLAAVCLLATAAALGECRTVLHAKNAERP